MKALFAAISLLLLLLVAFLATRRRPRVPMWLPYSPEGRWREPDDVQSPDPRTFGLFLSARDAPWQIDGWRDGDALN